MGQSYSGIAIGFSRLSYAELRCTSTKLNTTRSNPDNHELFPLHDRGAAEFYAMPFPPHSIFETSLIAFSGQATTQSPHA